MDHRPDQRLRLNSDQTKGFQDAHLPSQLVPGPMQRICCVSFRKRQITGPQLDSFPLVFVGACLCQTVKIQLEGSVIKPDRIRHQLSHEVCDLLGCEHRVALLATMKMTAVAWLPH